MATYLKKAIQKTEASDGKTKDIVKRILSDIRSRGESAVCEMAAKFDNWTRDFILTKEEIQSLIDLVPSSAKSDIRFAYDQVYGFAHKQRESMKAFETELSPGVILGQRLVPCQCAGCYVPGGRFAHAASAIMSVATAKAAGVPFVVACTPPRGDRINPTVAYALSLSGADVIMALGGVQAIGTMAFGLFTGKPADILVGPGNAYVAEAKRELFGEIGIDVFAGPTESLIIADQTADPMVVAVDLVSQCEHGYDSPVWLLTDSQKLGEKVIEIMPKVIADLPNPEVAASSWNDFGEVVLCQDREELATRNDEYAAEHVQVIAADLDWYLEHLKNYGSLFIGEDTAEVYADKIAGPNHILPTGAAARYTGGLWVGMFLKVVTHMEVDRPASLKLAKYAETQGAYEGMDAHRFAAAIRLRNLKE